MATLRPSLLPLLAVLLLSPQAVAAADTPDREPELDETAKEYLGTLQSSEEYRRLFFAIYSLIQRLHYLKRPLTLDFSTQVYDTYVEALDPQNRIFLATDLAPIEQNEEMLYNSLKNRRLTISSALYRLHQRRSIQALQYQLQLLEDNAFDFSRHEFLLTDRKEEARPTSWDEWKDYWRRLAKNQLLSLLLDDVSLEDAVSRLKRRLHNRRLTILRKSPEYSMATFVNALLSQYDPHTTYMPPEEYRDWLITLQTQLEGIGAVLTVRDDYVEVVRLIPGGPAEKSRQIGPGDRITGVSRLKGDAMLDVIGMNLTEVVRLIRGKKGTTVQLEVLPKSFDSGAPPELLDLVRDVIPLENQRASAEVLEFEMLGQPWRIGTIKLPSFYGSSPTSKSTHTASGDVQRLIKDLQARQVQGIVLDLRGNGGGYLHEANAITSLFVPAGTFVQIKSADGRVKPDSPPRKRVAWEGPLAVLVNRLSASASEIVAAAIQDYRRGLVVGSTTFGKGTVQGTYSIPNKQGQLKLTRSQFYRVNGGATQNRGVIPDVALPAVWDPEDIGESTNPHALGFDAVRKLPLGNTHNRWPQADLELLNRSHVQRRQASPAMLYLEKRRRLLKTMEDDSRLPLWTTARKERNQKIELAQLELENELREARGLDDFSDWKSYTQWLRDQRTDPNFAFVWEKALLQEGAQVLAQHIHRAWPQYDENYKGWQAIQQ